MSFWKVFLFPAKINRVGDLCCSAVSPASDHPCTRNVTFQYYWYYAVPPSRVTRKVSLAGKQFYFFLRGTELRNFLRGFWVIECNGSASRTKWSFRKQKPIILTAQFALIPFIGGLTDFTFCCASNTVESKQRNWNIIESRNLTNRQVQWSVSFMSGKIFNSRRVNLVVKYLLFEWIDGHSSTSMTSAYSVTKITFRFHLHQSHLEMDDQMSQIACLFFSWNKKKFLFFCVVVFWSDKNERRNLRENKSQGLEVSGHHLLKRAAERLSTCSENSIYLQTTQTFETPCHLRVDVDRRRDKLFKFP